MGNWSNIVGLGINIGNINKSGDIGLFALNNRNFFCLCSSQISQHNSVLNRSWSFDSLDARYLMSCSINVVLLQGGKYNFSLCFRVINVIGCD